MKLVALSDLHLDINTKRKDMGFIEKLIEYLETQSADVLVVTGDIAGKSSILVDFFKKTRDLPYQYKLYVPGNHDIWVNQLSKNMSWIKYYDILPKLVTSFDWHFVPTNPIVINKVGFIGTMGWYNYSTRNKIWDDTISKKQYEQKIHPSRTVELMDRHFVRFGKSDEEIARKMLHDLEDDWNELKNNQTSTQFEQLIVLTHMVPFREFINYRGILRYDFFTAYFGDTNLGNFIRSLSLDLPTYAIFGQTHVPKINKLGDHLMAYCVPIGYPREYGTDIDIQTLFNERIIQITLP